MLRAGGGGESSSLCMYGGRSPFNISWKKRKGVERSITVSHQWGGVDGRVGRPVNHSINHIIHSFSQSVSRSVGRSVCQSVNRSVSQSVGQLVSWAALHPRLAD